MLPFLVVTAVFQLSQMRYCGLLNHTFVERLVGMLH